MDSTWSAFSYFPQNFKSYQKKNECFNTQSLQTMPSLTFMQSQVYVSMYNYKKYASYNTQKCWKWVLMEHSAILEFFQKGFKVLFCHLGDLGQENDTTTRAAPRSYCAHVLLLPAHWFSAHTPRGVSEDKNNPAPFE